MKITAELGDDMKKLLLITLFSFMAVGAHAEDSAQKKDSYKLEIEKIQLANDSSICGQKWRIVVTNVGDGSSPRGLVASPSIEYGQDEDDQVYESQMADQVIDPIGSGRSRDITGQVVSLFAHEKDLVIRIKDGEEVVLSKSVTLPDNTDYSIVLGDAVLAGGKFIVPIVNEGSASASSLMVIIRGITGSRSRSTFKVAENTMTCSPAGEVSTMSIPEVKQEHIGYRVQVYRMGGTDLLAARDYIQ